MKIYRLEIQVESVSVADRSKIESEIRRMVESIPTAKVIRSSSSFRYTHCRDCGIPYKYGTLSSGLAGYSKDLCKPAYARSCAARKNRGGWQADRAG